LGLVNGVDIQDLLSFRTKGRKEREREGEKEGEIGWIKRLINQSTSCGWGTGQELTTAIDYK
jgi:hypothetical protein